MNTATLNGATLNGAVLFVAPPADLPADLLGAIKEYWTAAGLDATVGPLRTEAGEPKAPLPRAVIHDVDEHLPGETAEDRPVELWVAVHAAGLADAKARAKALVAALDPGPGREPLAWQTGTETFNVRDDSIVSRAKGTAPGGDGYVYSVDTLYRFWINGDP